MWGLLYGDPGIPRPPLLRCVFLLRLCLLSSRVVGASVVQSRCAQGRLLRRVRAHAVTAEASPEKAVAGRRRTSLHRGWLCGASQMLHIRRTGGLWQLCIRRLSVASSNVCPWPFPNSICSLRMSVSHVGRSPNISNFSWSLCLLFGPERWLAFCCIFTYRFVHCFLGRAAAAH